MDFSPEDNDQLFADAEYIESNICKKHLKVHCDYCSRMKDAEMEILFDEEENTLLYQCAQSVEEKMDNESDEGENTLLYQCAQSIEEKMDNKSGKPKTGGKTVQCSVCFARFKKNEDLVKHKEEHAKERGTPDEAVPSTSHFSHDTSQQEGCGDEAVPSSSPLSHDTSQQEGCGDEDAYEIHLKSSKTFKNKAMENVYGVTFNEKWRGQRLLDIHANLMKMFEDVIREATRGMDTKDLGRVVIQHPDVEPIVVSLRPIGELTPSCVLEYVMKVLNSHQELALNVDFRIDVGVIDIPKGGKRLHFTQLRGDNNSLSRKKAIVEIVNDDNLCLARAIAVCWAKQNVCPRGEWRKITKERKGRSNLQLILDTGKMPSTHYENLRKRNSREQRELAAALTSKVGLPLDRPCTITDISVFEDVLHLRILVIDSALGNRFCRIGAQSDRPCIFLYLVDGNHFHAINTITGFFSNNYFCMKCLKPYSNVAKHACGGPCLICKRSDECVVMDDPVSCRSCRMECRSMECFQYHKLTPEEKGKRQTLNARDSLSECSKYWRCIKCHKTVDRRNRNLLENPHECGEWTCKNCTEVVFGNHRCYMRSLKKEIKDKFFIFFDFECDQSSPVQCRENYLPKEGSRVCQHCSTDWCGRNQHKPNFVVAHTSCSACQEKPIEVRCKNCGTRCKKCEKKKEGSYIRSPCADTCGNREMVFKGYESAVHFGRWLFQEKHFGAKVVAHNLQGYDGTFILRYLVDNCMTPTHIIYNGSKIMSMNVGKGLHIRLVDSLNFLSMSLKKLPKTFSLTAEDEEIRKGYFPHFFNTIENQNYIGEYPAPQDYGMNSMNVEDRHDFLKWYKEKKSKGAIFDFAKEIEAYCRDDVTILRKACLKFRELIFTQTNNEVDAFDSVTIASMCMTIFRTCFLPEEHRVHLVTNTDLALPTRWVNGHGEVWYVDRWLSPKNLLHTHNLVVECRKHQGDEDVRVKKSLGWHTYLSDKGVRYEDRWYSHADLQEMSIREHEREFVKSPIALIPAAGYRRLDNYSKESIEWLEWVMEKNKKQGKLTDSFRWVLQRDQYCIRVFRLQVARVSSLYAERTGQDQTSRDEADDDRIVLPDQNQKADHRKCRLQIRVDLGARFPIETERKRTNETVRQFPRFTATFGCSR